jgi:glycosyltransferase involved in cell wall biosynthesis
MHLRWADIVISANQRQHDRACAELARIRRADDGPQLMVVPMGVPDPAPPSSGHPIRDRFPAIGSDDPVILWWGMVWRWLDAETAIEAIRRLIERRPDVRLVFTAGRPSGAPTDPDPLNATDETRELARAQGLLNRNVFFLEDWVDYEDRHLFLRDADLGLTLHRESAEANVAARFRYTDYLWADLPCVLAAGDEGSEHLAAAGAARLVPPGDAGATANALEDLISHPDALADARQACRDLAETMRWSRLLPQVVQRVEATALVRRAPGQTIRLTSDASRYYARRALDRCLD